MATEWSLDFCLVCDRQTLGGPYCSQSCRLAELDLGSSSEATISTSRQFPRDCPRTVRATSARDAAPTNSNSHPQTTSTVLSPSSSQTSLSSLKSNSSRNSSISDRYQNELRDYASCFDHVRDLKRRLTLS